MRKSYKDYLGKYCTLDLGEYSELPWKALLLREDEHFVSFVKKDLFGVVGKNAIQRLVLVGGAEEGSSPSQATAAEHADDPSEKDFHKEDDRFLFQYLVNKTCKIQTKGSLWNYMGPYVSALTVLDDDSIEVQSRNGNIVVPLSSVAYMLEN